MTGKNTAERRAADLVLAGGPVLALDLAGTRAEAVAISGGRIAALGEEAEIRSLIGEGTRVIELAGRAVIPGINDSHLHACWLGARWPNVMFGGGDPVVQPADEVRLETRVERRVALLRAGELLSEYGITSYTEPGIGPGEDGGETGCFHSEVIEVYRELAAAGELRQRVTLLKLFGVLDGPSDLDTVRAGIRALARERELGPGGGIGVGAWFAIPGVKVFGDLIPLSRQAWTSRAYDDGTHGDLLVRGDTLAERAAALAEMVREAHLGGLQLGIHATGDRTIQLVIDAITAAATEDGAPDPAGLGHVVIHGDLATGRQVRRMAELGMWLNAQSGIAARTGDWLASKLGADAAAEAWPFEEALDAGVLVLSSDAPVLGPDWRHGIADAEARILAAGGAPHPASARRRLHGLLRAYTAVPAAQDGAASWKGTLEPGKVADLAVLSADPFSVGAAGLPAVAVDATIVDGRVVFERAR